MNNIHSFVVCAYKESPYLKDCIESLLGQTIRTNVVVATSTPNRHIIDICNYYGVKLHIGKHESGIARDWTFALECGDAQFITIAHQDDIYKHNYAERALQALSKSDHPLIYFSDYAELRDGEEIIDDKLLRIKRLMLSPLKNQKLAGSKFVRRRILSLGDPICCPSVTYAVNNLEAPVFVDGFKGSLDWQAWEKASRQSGDFLYDSEILLCHRIHSESETTHLIESKVRTKEDFEIYKMFWPVPIAWLLSTIYANSQRNNTL